METKLYWAMVYVAVGLLIGWLLGVADMALFYAA